MTSTEPLVICTAWNKDFAKLGELCSEAILQHIRRVEAKGGSGITFVSQLIPEDYPRPASWYKLKLVRELLESNPHVLWMDCDALLMDQGDIREQVNLSWHCPLQIARDENGLNAGVMWFNQGPDTIPILDRIEALSGKYLNHQWWETAAFNDDFAINPKNYAILEKEVWNAYTQELNPRTKILHLAGFKLEERIKIMEAFEYAIRRNGHGPRQ